MESSLPLWIIEDCTWPVLWGLLSTVALGTFWFISRQIAFLIAALAIFGLVIATIALEMAVTTDKEYVVNSVYAMAEAVKNNDPEGIVQFVDPENQVFADRVRQEMAKYEFKVCSVNGFAMVELGNPDSVPRIATVAFSVWATGSYRGRLDTLNSSIVAVKLEFAKSGDKWYVQRYAYQPGPAPPGNLVFRH